MNKSLNIPSDLIKAVNESFKNMRDSLKIIPEYLVELANLGWFISLDLTPRETGEICLKIKENNIQAIDNYMVDYVVHKIDRVEKEVIKAFPKRIKPLEAGFRAYRKKEYYLSIPVLIAQIDGICKDSFEQYFFTSNKNKKKKTRKKFSDLNYNEILNAFFTPTGEKINISKNKDEFQDAKHKVYNRHEIMHGIDNDYGNKINCLKIISLLDYIVQITNPKKY
ncbi:MAG: hypothetical protein KAT68_12810 [Bacteroidales bacterium]|nr:hypothetical protein [Bacteroidales bacterium]